MQAFAIPIDRAESIARQITSGTASGTVHIGATAFLGVGVQSAAQSQAGGTTSGAVVAGAEPGTAAARAGLTAGDVIPSGAGHAVSSPTALRDLLISQHPGDRVSVGWTDSSGQSHTATVTLGSGPAA